MPLCGLLKKNKRKRKRTEMKVLFSFWKHEVMLPRWRGPSHGEGLQRKGRWPGIALQCPASLSASSGDSGAEWEKQAEAQVDLGLAFLDEFPEPALFGLA